MYLDPQGIDSTLQFVAKHSAPGSSVVFDYVVRSVIEGTLDDFMCKRAVAALARRGEPWIYGIKRGEAERFVSERGLLLLSDLGPDELEVLYLIRSDGSVDGPMFRCSRILHAFVPCSPLKGD